ncbi:MAG: methyltransferase domain-containing protein [Planctomycetes bacterium]|nr:methyltransferase domain-containing protein [Planctomycetota bacterium]
MPAPPIPLLDLLACPDCRAPLQRDAASLRCTGCGSGHPVREGIPFLLPQAQRGLQIEHERELEVRSHYPKGVARLLDALARDQVVLDLGSGERETDDPRVLCTDLRFTPRVDLVSDAHVLPLRDACVDLVLAGAVFEHLRDPFAAAGEIHRVLKPGGQVIADCSFVFPFHGFPASYFHASGEGLQRIFAGFRKVAVEVPPWLMPSYGLEVLLGEWLRFCKPRTEHDRRFLAAIRALGGFDARALDACFDQEHALRIAAGTCFLGLKQPRGDETVLPPPALELWHGDAALRQRYPDPAVLLPTLREDAPDTFVHWAAGEGRARSAALADWYAARPTVQKRLDPS